MSEEPSRFRKAHPIIVNYIIKIADQIKEERINAVARELESKLYMDVETLISSTKPIPVTDWESYDFVINFKEGTSEKKSKNSTL